MFAVHPQRIFYSSPEELIAQDRLISVAAKIAKIKFIEGYYSNRTWRKVVPVNFANPVKREHFGIEFAVSQSETLASNSDSKETFPLITYDPKVAEPSIVQKPAGRWDVYFNDRAPCSITESRSVASQALAGMDKHVGSYSWESPADFPDIIYQCFDRQKEGIFKGISVDSKEDIRTAYDKRGATSEGALLEDPSMSDMVLALINPLVNRSTS